MMRDSGNQNQKIWKQIKRLAKIFWLKIVDLYRLSFWQSSQWLKYAEKQSASGNLDCALISCNQAIKRDNNNYFAWHKKGLVLARLKRYNEAIIAYNRALKINSNLDLAWVSKGDLLSAQKQTRAGADCYQQALKINCKDAQVNIKLNSLLEQLKQSVEALLSQGDKLYTAKDFQAAITIYEQATTLRPDLDTPWYKSGNALAALNRYQEAIAAYDKTLQINKNHYPSLCCKGNVLCKLQFYQAAIDCYNQALIIKPNAPEILNQRELALKELQKLEMRIENMLHQGISFYENNQYEEAIKIYDQALEIISKNLLAKS
ncbi:tetratricopeptide TPR_2 [Calothrix sp. NIES-4071]|nr:tetratricopeptide TPR_2 [Calothrix sp. NIES-4071]BAZ56425.1 tetratricopeptide TPR_2 [Calothrix sp. NIES-4105]